MPYTFRDGQRLGLFCDKAVIAMIACLVNVEKCHDVAFPRAIAVDVGNASANLCDSADAHVAGNDGVRDAGQFAVQQMNIGAAHFGIHCMQENAAGLELRLRKFPKLDRHIRRRHDSSEVSAGHSTQYTRWLITVA